MAERDFNLEMTGEQVKDALQQLEDRVAEGWAVGAKDGTPVTSGSPYYENNSKYWATQAENAATRAESAVPAGVDSAVLFTQEQQLTTDQQAQARQNIKAGGSNPNLLDNPWFTVNQRGRSRYTGPGYTVDRWKTGATGATIDIDENGVTLSPDASFGFQQKLTTELVTALVGKTVTYSILLQNGTLRTLTFTWPNSPNVGVGVISGIGTLFAGTTLGISLAHPSTLSIRAIKLELGSVSTLANDAPPNYAEELAKCQRYFIRLAGSYGPVGLGAVVSTTIATCMLPLPVPMRATPTVTLTGTLYTNGRAAIAVQSFTTAPPSGNAIGMNITSTGALIVGEAVLLQFRDANSHLDLSADL